MTTSPVVRDRALLICTLRYSSNLGDGVIGDCLEHLVRKVQPNRSVGHIDMAGRESFPSSVGGPAGTRANLAKLIFYHSPNWMRPLLTRLAWPLLFRPKIDRAWAVARPDGPFDLVFGGGQMLSDLGLNFPLKFAHVVRLASREGARIAVSGVGVSALWSTTARELFAGALCHSSVCSWAVRDGRSRDRLQIHVPALRDKVEITVDAGIWAAEVYGIEAYSSGREDLAIGLGVSEPAELASYSDSAAAFTEDKMLAYWLELTRILVDRGHHPRLFTNGSEEDEAFLDRLSERLTSEMIAFERLPRARAPHELADRFRNLDALVSHRLHANIIAFSAGIPSVALVWDDKVAAFAEEAGRRKWVLNTDATAEETADLVCAAARSGVDTTRRDALKDRSLYDVRTMLRRLEDHPA